MVSAAARLANLAEKFRAEDQSIRGNAASDVSFSGNYPDWESARRASGGYDDPEIFERVRRAVQKVKTGAAVFERDSVTFDTVQYSSSLLAGLMYVCARRGGRLNLIDFGGSLGSTYFQNRSLLDSFPGVRWAVVEQPGFVSIGQREFQDDRLCFFETIEAAANSTIARKAENHGIDVVLFSSVLQYLPDWTAVIRQARDQHIPYILIDRTPLFIGDEPARITVERVPENIYPATYPARFFNSTEFKAALTGAGYKEIFDFESWERWDLGDARAVTHCMLYEKI